MNMSLPHFDLHSLFYFLFDMETTLLFLNNLENCWYIIEEYSEPCQAANMFDRVLNTPLAWLVKHSLTMKL